jgi:transglutaminase-like putative cysteine protease
MRLSTKEEALGEIQAPEIMVSTFIKPDRPIKNARASTQAVYLVSVAEGDLSLPSTGHQSVEVVNERSVRVSVSREAMHPAPADDVDNPDFTSASAMIDTQDAEVRKLAQRALAKSADDTPAGRAEAIRRFVHSYINRKNLGVGFASASEVARKRTGDCSEHGVLAAALLRCAGIPSRVVAGVIYADAFAGSQEIFGYHMWAQGLITIDGQPRWVDLDPTLDDRTPFDAAHIALGVTALPEGELATSLSTTATTLGRLKISVESVSAVQPEPAGAK